MKLRIEDALNATRAAVEEGIVAGGGTALVNVIPAVADLELTGDEATGRNIVLRALEEPVRQIAHNAGFEGSIVIDRLKNAEVGTGFNAATGEWVNMIDQGIIDPVKVSRSALQNAASVAQATTASINTVVEDIARQTIPSADKIAAAVVNQQSQIIANAEQQTPEMVEAQTNYVDALKIDRKC